MRIKRVYSIQVRRKKVSWCVDGGGLGSSELAPREREECGLLNDKCYFDACLVGFQGRIPHRMVCAQRTSEASLSACKLVWYRRI